MCKDLIVVLLFGVHTEPYTCHLTVSVSVRLLALLFCPFLCQVPQSGSVMEKHFSVTECGFVMDEDEETRLG